MLQEVPVFRKWIVQKCVVQNKFPKNRARFRHNGNCRVGPIEKSKCFRYLIFEEYGGENSFGFKKQSCFQNLTTLVLV
ncbi:hypothetical protein EBT16_11075 [bacterium]|nr:hypothetical protein [bacterium]